MVTVVKNITTSLSQRSMAWKIWLLRELGPTVKVYPLELHASTLFVGKETVKAACDLPF
jgi:hypothetical protein